MKKFTSIETTKAMQELVDIIGETKREYPIEFGLHGKQAVPTVSKPVASDDEDKKKKAKTVSISIGSEESGGFINANVVINRHGFINAAGKEAFIEVPTLPTTDIEELLRTAKGLAEIFVAVRNTVMMTTATHPLYINNSTVEPATGVILADILSSSDRLEQKTAVKNIISGLEDIEGSELNTYLSKYNTDKAYKNLIESIGYITAVKFGEGCDSLLKTITKLKEKGDATQIAKTADYSAVLVDRKETKMEEVERRTSVTKKLKSLV